MPIVLRAYMHYDVRPTDEWTCNLEMDYEGSLEAGEVESAAMDFAAGLSNLLLTNVVIDRVVASTWASDSSPYNPSALKVVPIGINGTKVFLLTSPVDDDLVLFIRKAVNTGRSGKIMLRGVLTLSEIDVDSGSWYIVPSALATIEGLVADFFADITNQFNPVLVGKSLINTILPAVAEGVKQIPIKVFSANPIVRYVTGLVVAGITERQDTQ